MDVVTPSVPGGVNCATLKTTNITVGPRIRETKAEPEVGLLPTDE